MDTSKPQSHRTLLVILVLLYVLTIAAMISVEWVASSGNISWINVLVNIPILSIPLVLIYGSIYVLLISWQEYKASGQVSPRRAKLIHWAPRITAILIILFTSLFSLDVFESEGSPLQLLGAFLMHNIPSLVMIVVLVFAWKRPVVGFVTFLVTAVAFTFFFVRSIFALQNLLLFVLPILFVASLFYADWKWLKPQLHSN